MWPAISLKIFSSKGYLNSAPISRNTSRVIFSTLVKAILSLCSNNLAKTYLCPIRIRSIHFNLRALKINLILNCKRYVTFLTHLFALITFHMLHLNKTLKNPAPICIGLLLNGCLPNNTRLGALGLGAGSTNCWRLDYASSKLIQSLGLVTICNLIGF